MKMTKVLLEFGIKLVFILHAFFRESSIYLCNDIGGDSWMIDLSNSFAIPCADITVSQKNSLVLVLLAEISKTPDISLPIIVLFHPNENIFDDFFFSI